MAVWAVLGIAVLALALSGVGVWAAVAWRRSHRQLDALAEQLYVDSRIETLTVQTLAAMREVARRGGGHC